MFFLKNASNYDLLKGLDKNCCSFFIVLFRKLLYYNSNWSFVTRYWPILL